MPLFSIVTATYNRANCIERCIESVQHQNFTDYEYIIVDDGSGDNTAEIVNKYSFIEFIKLDKNYGVCKAKNTGALRAKGEFIIILDSDNYLLHENVLGDMATIIKQNFYPLYFFKCKFESKNRYPANIINDTLLDYKLYLNMIIGEYIPTIKRNIFCKNLFFEQVQGGEGLIWRKIVQTTNQIYISNYETIFYDESNENRLCNTNKDKRKNKEKYKTTLNLSLFSIKLFWRDDIKFAPKNFILTLKTFIIYFIVLKCWWLFVLFLNIYYKFKNSKNTVRFLIL